MDYVYVCREGNNEELRYSIRSVEANLPKGNIWVVGGKPSWYTGLYIPVKSHSGKQRNAIQNLLKIVESKEIPEDFVLMNDDFFIVRPVSKIKFYHGGSLENKIKTRRDFTPGSRYLSLLSKTEKALQKRGIDKPLDYDIHVPMPMTKSGLKAALDLGIQWRSAYGNIYRVGGTKIKDVKVYGSINFSELSYNPDSLDSEYISTDDSSFPLVYKKILKGMFPNPSSCELAQDRKNISIGQN
jgi:hypothetical protein